MNLETVLKEENLEDSYEFQRIVKYLQEECKLNPDVIDKITNTTRTLSCAYECVSIQARNGTIGSKCARGGCMVDDSIVFKLILDYLTEEGIEPVGNDAPKPTPPPPKEETKPTVEPKEEESNEDEEEVKNEENDLNVSKNDLKFENEREVISTPKVARTKEKPRKIEPERKLSLFDLDF